MSDWQVGDLAVCLDDAPCRCGCGANLGIRAGEVRVVVRVAVTVAGNIGIYFDGRKPKTHSAPGGGADRFRKIRPDEHEACEPEFVTLLKRSRKTVRA